MAVPPLRALVGAGFDVRTVVTRADKRRGRGGARQPSPVKEAAVELDLPVTTDVDEVLTGGVELGVVVAFGRIIRPHVLAAVPMVNLHFSLLPRWRGAAPVERALLAGDDRTGVCVMAVEETLDTGGVYARREISIGPRDTAGDLRVRLVAEGTALLVATLQGGLSPPSPQTGEATYAEKVDPAELELRWDQPAVVLDRVIRLGGAWTRFRGRRLRVWRATACTDPSVAADLGPGQLDPVSLAVGTGTQPVVLVEVQPEGKGRQPAEAWRHGAHLAEGELLGAEPPA